MSVVYIVCVSFIMILWSLVVVSWSELWANNQNIIKLEWRLKYDRRLNILYRTDSLIYVNEVTVGMNVPHVSAHVQNAGRVNEDVMKPWIWDAFTYCEVSSPFYCILPSVCTVLSIQCAYVWSEVLMRAPDRQAAQTGSPVSRYLEAW